LQMTVRYNYKQGEAGQYTVEAENGEEKTTEKLVQEKEEAADEIKVYVVGEVNKPGVVTLKKGQIIQDAIELAGGPTEDADIENINLAYELRENVMIRVMSKSETTGQDIGEEGDMQVAAGNTENKSTAAGSNSPRIVSRRMFPAEQAKTVQAQMMQKAIREKAPTMGCFRNSRYKGQRRGGSRRENASSSENSKTANSKININTATVEELDSLPGIGPAIAAKIVAYREQNGKFKSIEDIMNVSGIGQSKFNNIKDFITVN